MKLFVFSTLLAVAAAFTSQPLTGPAKLVDSPARSRTATIVHGGNQNGTLVCCRARAYVRATILVGAKDKIRWRGPK